MIPTTVDEATQDPPPAAPPPQPPASTKSPIGAKTLFDPAPFGSEGSPPASVPLSQVHTPMVPPNDPNSPHMMKTMADPEMAERAAKVRDQILASQELKAKTIDQKEIKTPIAEPSPLVVPVAKTLLLGGEGGPPNPLAAAEPPPPSQASPSPSPLSESVYAPGGIPVAPIPPAQVAPPPPSQQQHAPPGALKTMLGMPAADLPPPPSQVQPPPASQQAGPLKTMLGVAMPGIAPTHGEPPPPSQPLDLPSQKGTMLGVAVPGIAPTHEPRKLGGTVPLQQYPSSSHMPAAAPVAPAPLPPIVPAPPPLYEEPLPEAPQRPQQRGVPAVAVVGIIIVLLALAGTAAAFFILRSSATITAQPLLDENGKESLKMKCESCPDGTIVALGASSATVQGSAALLPLPAPLSIGDNDLSVKIDRPGSGRDEDVKVHVPVAYRVRADLTTLTAKPPAITVRVEATQGSEVTIDGKPVVLDDSGRGSYAIDVTTEVEGASDEQKTIDKKIPFTIKPKGRPQEEGQLIARASVIPLHIDSPGRDVITDKGTAAISGQTKVGATVTIDGQPTPVDAQGRFGVRVVLDTPGSKSLQIVASSPPLAPRTFKAKVTRVASLDAAAKELDAASPLGFEAFSQDPTSNVGKEVHVEGEIVEARVAQGHSILLVEERTACAKGASCLVRIVHGEELKANRGEHVRAYGFLEGTVSASGKTVPDIEGRLVIVNAKGGK